MIMKVMTKPERNARNLERRDARVAARDRAASISRDLSGLEVSENHGEQRDLRMRIADSRRGIILACPQT